MVNSINPSRDPLNIEQEKLRDPSNVKGSFQEKVETGSAEKKDSPMDLNTKLNILQKAKELEEKYGDSNPTTDNVNPSVRNIK